VRAAGVEAPKARPVTITYVDAAGAAPKLTRKAALIETIGDVADRLKAKEAFVIDSVESMDEGGDEVAASVAKMDTDEVVRVQLVEGMVGNSDFRLHPQIEKWWFTKNAPETVSPMWNMKAVRLPDGKERPLPVDFDLSALVAPPTYSPQYPTFWAGSSAETQSQLAIVMASRMRFSRAALDGARRGLAAREADLTALLQTSWLDPEARAVATRLFTAFFGLMKNDRDFYIDVVSGENIDYLRPDGTPDDECLANTVRPGTPIHRFGTKNAALGIEEVALLDVRLDLPCNQDKVWLKTGTVSTTEFPR